MTIKTLTTFLLIIFLVLLTENQSHARNVNIELTSKEVNWAYDNIDTKMRAYTFNGEIPAPVIRVREGDIVNIKLTNDEKSKHFHSLDVHGMNIN